MAFQPVNLTLWSAPQAPGNQGNLPQWWGYLTTTDSVDVVSADGYFNVDSNVLLQNTSFRVGDLMYCVCTDGPIELEIATLTPNITTSALSNVGPNSVNTAAIQNQAVTAAKIANGAITTAQISGAAGILGTQLAANTVGAGQIANGAITTAQISGTAGILGTQLAANTVGAGQIANGTITTAQISGAAGILGTQLAANTVGAGQIAVNGLTSTTLALNTIQYIQVAMTAAQWNAMATTPFQILPAPGAGLIYQLETVWYSMAYTAPAYSGGGIVNLQYGSTASGNGIPVTADTIATAITGLTVSSIIRPGLSVTAMAQSATVNQGLFMSNRTGAFTGGASTWKINLAYRVITA